MKTRTKYYANLIAGLFIAFVSLLTSVRANAQQRDLYFGFESTASNRKYTVHSDLNNLKSKVMLQQGRTYAIIFGSSIVTGKFSIGNFSSPGKDNDQLKSNSTELSLNIGLLQLISKQDRVIEPYFVTSVETTKVKSAGTYVPEVYPTAAAAASASSCSCQCPLASSAASTLSSAAKTPEPYSGRFGTTRINLGLGLNVHLSKGNLFVNLFAEAKYGKAAGTTASTQALLYTYALNQVAYTMGASIGLTKDRSHGRLRKYRFR